MRKLYFYALSLSLLMIQTALANPVIGEHIIDARAPNSNQTALISTLPNNGGIVQLEMTDVPENINAAPVIVEYIDFNGTPAAEELIPNQNGDINFSLNANHYSEIYVTVRNDLNPDTTPTRVTATLLHDTATETLSAAHPSTDIQFGHIAPDTSLLYKIFLESMNGGIVQLEMTDVPENINAAPVIVEYIDFNGTPAAEELNPNQNGEINFSLNASYNSDIYVTVRNDLNPDANPTRVTATLLHDTATETLSAAHPSTDIQFGHIAPDTSLLYKIFLESMNGGIVQLEMTDVPENTYAAPVIVEYIDFNGTPAAEELNPNQNGEINFSLNANYNSDIHVTVRNDLNPDANPTRVTATLLHNTDKETIQGDSYVARINFGKSSNGAELLFPIEASDGKLELDFSNLPTTRMGESLRLDYLDSDGTPTVETFDASETNNRYERSLSVKTNSTVYVTLKNDDFTNSAKDIFALASTSNDCDTLLNINANQNNRFTETCFSSEHNQRLAHFYSFYVEQEGEYNIEVWSNTHPDLDTFAYLHEVNEYGTTIIASDDNSSGRTELGSKISRVNLKKGWYVVEATTLQGRKNGRHVVRAWQIIN